MKIETSEIVKAPTGQQVLKPKKGKERFRVRYLCRASAINWNVYEAIEQLGPSIEVEKIKGEVP